MPVVTVVVASLIGLTGPALVTALLFQALPTASSAYIMARQLGGDAPLMAGITATQTLFALVALPVAAAAIGVLGP
jgi:predicted permease